MPIQTISKPAANRSDLRDFKRFVHSFSHRRLLSEPITAAEREKIESNISSIRLCTRGSAGAAREYRLGDPLLKARLSDKWEICRHSPQISHRFENRMLLGIFKSAIFGMAAISVAPLFPNAASIAIGSVGAAFSIGALVGKISLERLNGAWGRLCSEYANPSFLKSRVEAAANRDSGQQHA
ncbi:MAG: hypothetical protein WC588_04905 [Candidatus Micrarchaeia archaeon]